MVHINSHLATAIIAFCASTLAAPAPDPYAPLGVAPIAKAATNAAQGPVPVMMTFTPEEVQHFSSEDVQPSNTTVESLETRGIIGPDNRVLWDRQDYPYSAMGRIEGSSGYACSGSLVGRRLVATAKHCVPPAGASVRFQPKYFNGERGGGSYATTIITMAQGNGACFQKEDWAIFVLADPMGDQDGYLGAKVINCDAQKNRAMFFHLGYPGDHGTQTPYRQEAITVSRCADCEPGGPLETDADAVGGQSGGPLWLLEDGSRYLYGVLSGESSVGAGFASGGNLVQAIGKARNDFP